MKKRHFKKEILLYSTKNGENKFLTEIFYFDILYIMKTIM